MKAVESEGVNVEQAVDRALILLDLAREQVEVEVIREPTSGEVGGAIVRVIPKGQAKPRPTAGTAVSRETAASRPRIEAPGEEGQTSADAADEAGLARTMLVDLLSHMGLSCRVEAPEEEEDSQRIRISVSGDDTAIVIGRQGQTLDAIELVVNRAVDRRMPGSRQITVDAESYRERRAQKLAESALLDAQEVRRLGRPVALEPMTPRDRRSIHMALREEPGITTKSEGEGQFRHIVIEPAGPLGLASPRARLR